MAEFVFTALSNDMKLTLLALVSLGKQNSCAENRAAQLSYLTTFPVVVVFMFLAVSRWSREWRTGNSSPSSRYAWIRGREECDGGGMCNVLLGAAVVCVARFYLYCSC